MSRWYHLRPENLTRSQTFHRRGGLCKYFDRCPSRRSIAPTSRSAVAAMLVCPAAIRRRQKDEETQLTWYLKDEVMRRGRVNSRETCGRPFDVCRAALDKAILSPSG